MALLSSTREGRRPAVCVACRRTCCLTCARRAPKSATMVLVCRAAALDAVAVIFAVALRTPSSPHHSSPGRAGADVRQALRCDLPPPMEFMHTTYHGRMKRAATSTSLPPRVTETERERKWGPVLVVLVRILVPGPGASDPVNITDWYRGSSREFAQEQRPEPVDARRCTGGADIEKALQRACAFGVAVDE